MNTNRFLVKVDGAKRIRYITVQATDGRDAANKARPQADGARILSVFVQIHEGDYGQAEAS